MSAGHATDDRGNAIERAGLWLANVVERYMPSPFLFAIILTYIVFAAGIGIEGAGPFEMVEFWFEGFWAFLSFSMQMVVILMTGFVIAYHPRVNEFITRLTELPNDARQSVVMVGFVAMVLGWIHWGFGLILGAIFAREMGKTAQRNGIGVHYPLLCVAGYMGLGLTWHWGLSGSAPLLIATPGNEFIQQGVLDGVVSTSETIFSTYALTLTVLSILYASAVLWVLSPSAERAESILEYVDERELSGLGTDVAADGGSEGASSADGNGDGTSVPGDESDPADASDTDGEEETYLAEKIDNSRLLGGVVALTGVVYVGYLFATQGLDALNLNVVNFGFLFVGLAIYTRPAVYRERFGEAAEAAAGIVLLFPFFAGIQGMMNDSGLSATVAEALFDISTAATFPVVAWITGSIVNLFVPSGGGEWIVLGPSVIEAAQRLGVPVGKATIAYAVGDAHTNLLNPFWAIPLLAITGIKAREMFGYAIAMLLALIPFLAVVLYVLPY